MRSTSTLSNDLKQSGSDKSPETTPQGDDSEIASVAGIYLQLFGRPPLGDHPELDGYAAGRMLAEEYPERMMRVMNGFRKGARKGSESADAAGGQDR